MKYLLLCISIFSSLNILAADLKVGDAAPLFSLPTEEGTTFNLENRKGTWTVLYFYPKAETPITAITTNAIRLSV